MVDLFLEDEARAGTGLSFDEDFCESARDFSPFVDEVDSLLDLRVLRSPGMVVEKELGLL